MCTIGADQDIAIVLGFVRTSNRDTVVVLLEREDSLPKYNVLPWYLAPQKVIQVWSWDD